MALQYRITKRNNSIQNNTPQYILQAISKGTIDLDKLSVDISNECSLHQVDVQAVLIALGIKMNFYLQDGYAIDMGDVGKFKMGLQGVAASTPEELSPKKNIKKFSINYQPSIKLKRMLKAGVKVFKEGSRHL
ncbi:DNA-binding protein, histone-like, putative [Polaribacter sp. KT25b]|uniref:HU family DNA-binding protein n=1 Tax=Polaribacter sp. KT25b TaxID=1855336 RepID=UPI00087971B8|nr:DNA-binding protein [Polaribacter sp. KT25b]SDR89637.1 DNA-binding protein, histone-like, putative [Polaribacter sp. KT25b]